MQAAAKKTVEDIGKQNIVIIIAHRFSMVRDAQAELKSRQKKNLIMSRIAKMNGVSAKKNWYLGQFNILFWR